MDGSDIAPDIASLPPEAQSQVTDFVAFLKSRYPTQAPSTGNQRPKLTDEPFIGMWRDREDMRDSTAWVSNVRRQGPERTA